MTKTTRNDWARGVHACIVTAVMLGAVVAAFGIAATISILWGRP